MKEDLLFMVEKFEKEHNCKFRMTVELESVTISFINECRDEILSVEHYYSRNQRKRKFWINSENKFDDAGSFSVNDYKFIGDLLDLNDDDIGLIKKADEVDPSVLPNNY